MALIDELRKRLAEQQQQIQPPIDAQAQLQKLAQAKTGKATAAAAPVASSLGQQQAQSQLASQAAQQGIQQQAAQGQLEAAAAQQQSAADSFRQRLAKEQALASQSLAAKGALATESLAGNEARAQRQLSVQESNKINAVSAASANQLNSLAAERRVATDDIFESFRQSNEELEFRKDAAQLEQYAFQASLANKAYVQEIEAVGKLRGLENDLNFKKEYASIKLGAEKESLLQQFGWQAAFDADEREFQMQMGSMSIDQAIALANAQIKQSNTQAIFTGGAKMASSYVANTPKKTPNPNPDGEGGEG